MTARLRRCIARFWWHWLWTPGWGYPPHDPPLPATETESDRQRFLEEHV